LVLEPRLAGTSDGIVLLSNDAPFSIAWNTSSTWISSSPLVVAGELAETAAAVVVVEVVAAFVAVVVLVAAVFAGEAGEEGVD